jgi:L-ascorbate metabolism protein UlaG (beta-lactamase superfamily)
MSRRVFLRNMVALGGAAALGACGTGMQPGAGSGGSARLAGGRIVVRWLGGGVVELATPDYKQIAYADAWIWNNSGWTRFNVQKPPEYATRDGWVRYVQSKNPEAVFVLLTHDHGDHIGDYVEMLKGLLDARLPVMTTGQSDLMRKGLVPEFQKAGIDHTKVVLHGGNAQNFGGIARHGAMSVRLVPAMHSTLAGYPAAGFVLDIGGVRVYISGDTDMFSEMQTIGERYQPNLGIIAIGNGPFTMGPAEAARACQWLRVQQAMPVHYAHNPLVRNVDAGEEFRKALAEIAPSVQAVVMRPGDSRTIQI